MRRQFNQDLVVSTPPKVRVAKSGRVYVCRKNLAFQKLLLSWIDKAGDQYCARDLAKRAAVKTKTANKWVQGHQAGKYSLWPIATYFEPLIEKPRKELYKLLCNTLIEF